LLSIVIVSYNTSELTLNCIKSIVDETQCIDYEIIVVDNNSSDNTVEQIKLRFPNVVVITNQENKGFAYALNIGIHRSSGDTVLSINSDTIIIDHAIEKSYNFLNDNSDIQILGIKVLNADGSFQHRLCGYLPSITNCLWEACFLMDIFPKSKIFGKYYMSYFDYNSTINVEWIRGTYMMIKKSVFEKIGFFDDSYFLYTEETDFMFRANKANLKTVFFHEAEIYHLEGASSRKNPERVYKMIHKTKLFYFKKNHKSPTNQMLILIQYLAMINRIIAYLIFGVVRIDSKYLKKSFDFLKAIL
jgi:GT2 family glycosyltransferase